MSTKFSNFKKVSVGSSVAGGVSRGLLYTNAYGSLAEDASRLSWDEQKRNLGVQSASFGDTQYYIICGDLGTKYSTNNGTSLSATAFSITGIPVWSFAEGPRWFFTSVSGGGGLFVTTDAGQTMKKYDSTNGLASDNVNSIFAQGRNWYVCTDAGLSISLDGGNNWTTKTSVDGMANNNPIEVVVSNGIIYAGSLAGLSISSDGGNTWTVKNASSGLSSDGAARVRVINSNVYVGEIGAINGVNAIDYSPDGGTTWSQLVSFGGDNINSMDVANGVIVANDNNSLVHISLDNGANWSIIGGGFTGNSQVLLVPYQNTLGLYCVDYSGARVLFSTNFGASYTTLAAPGSGPRSLAIFKGNSVTDVSGDSSQAGLAYRWPASHSHNGALKNDGSGNLTWASNWQAQTANYSASNGDRILADTSGGAFTITLPATPALGDEIIVMDATINWATDNLTVDRNGNNIDSIAADFTGNTDGSHVTFVYYNATVGWRTKMY